MEIENKQQLTTLLKRDDTFALIKTLAQSDSAVLNGTLVWGKHSTWPWWPGVVVSNSDVGWPISKKKGTYCILWLGPNKSASLMPAHKLSDFLNPNSIRLMNQPSNGDELEIAICEALRGLLSKQMLDEDELDMIPSERLKYLASQTRNQTDIVNGRKQVIVEKTSFWFKRTIESLKYANKGLRNISNKKREPRLPRTTNLQKRIFHPAIAHRLRSAKKVEEEDDEPPPRKKKALAKRTGHGALNKPKMGGMSLMHSFQQNKRFRNLELSKLSKLVEEEKTRVSDDDDIDLTIDRTADEEKVNLVARNRFRSLHHSGKIYIRNSKTDPSTLFVVKSTDNEAAVDNTLDIQSMKVESDVPNTVKELVVSEAAIADSPSTEERLKAMDLRHKKLVERLTKIDTELRSIWFK